MDGEVETARWLLVYSDIGRGAREVERGGESGSDGERKCNVNILGTYLV